MNYEFKNNNEEELDIEDSPVDVGIAALKKAPAFLARNITRESINYLLSGIDFPGKAYNALSQYSDSVNKSAKQEHLYEILNPSDEQKTYLSEHPEYKEILDKRADVLKKDLSLDKKAMEIPSLEKGLLNITPKKLKDWYAPHNKSEEMLDTLVTMISGPGVLKGEVAIGKILAKEGIAGLAKIGGKLTAKSIGKTTLKGVVHLTEAGAGLAAEKAVEATGGGPIAQTVAGITSMIGTGLLFNGQIGEIKNGIKGFYSGTEEAMNEALENSKVSLGTHYSPLFKDIVESSSAETKAPLSKAKLSFAQRVAARSESGFGTEAQKKALFKINKKEVWNRKELLEKDFKKFSSKQITYEEINDLIKEAKKIDIKDLASEYGIKSKNTKEIAKLEKFRTDFIDKTKDAREVLHKKGMKPGFTTTMDINKAVPSMNKVLKETSGFTTKEGKKINTALKDILSSTQETSLKGNKIGLEQLLSADQAINSYEAYMKPSVFGGKNPEGLFKNIHNELNESIMKFEKSFPEVINQYKSGKAMHSALMTGLEAKSNLIGYFPKITKGLTNSGLIALSFFTGGTSFLAKFGTLAAGKLGLNITSNIKGAISASLKNSEIRNIYLKSLVKLSSRGIGMRIAQKQLNQLGSVLEKNANDFSYNDVVIKRLTPKSKSVDPIEENNDFNYYVKRLTPKHQNDKSIKNVLI